MLIRLEVLQAAVGIQVQEPLHCETAPCRRARNPLCGSLGPWLQNAGAVQRSDRVGPLQDNKEIGVGPFRRALLILDLIKAFD